MALTTKRLIIKGRVQGVGFRYSFQMVATRLGLFGWVCNRRDGSVEAVVQGDESLVQEVLRWAEQGPSAAHVDEVDVSNATGEFSDFSIRDTY